MNVKELFSLDQQCAIVVGGAGKIGTPMVEALAEAGANVVIASKNAEKTLSEGLDHYHDRGLSVSNINMDQSSEESVTNALQKITAKHGSPSILINSGYVRPMMDFYDDTVENWDSSMVINSRGLFITCRIFGNAMAKNGTGSIINISSIYGVVAPDMAVYDGVDFETEPDYPFVKGGTIAYTKYLASYYAKKGVRVNCIIPGGMFNSQPEPFLTNFKNKTLQNRMAKFDDMKGPALFLASNASSYVTGTTLIVDGGFTAI